MKGFNSFGSSKWENALPSGPYATHCPKYPERNVLAKAAVQKDLNKYEQVHRQAEETICSKFWRMKDEKKTNKKSNSNKNNKKILKLKNKLYE